MASKRPHGDPSPGSDGLWNGRGGSTGRESSSKRPRRTAADPKGRARAQAEARMAEVLTSLMKHKHASLFLTPVDSSTAPGYEKYVKMPMDLGTIDKRLKTGGYAGDIEAFTADVRLVFANCLAYNPPGDWARAWGESCGGAFEAMFNAKLAPLLARSHPVEKEPPEENEARNLGTLGPKSKKLKVKFKRNSTTTVPPPSTSGPLSADDEVLSDAGEDSHQHEGSAFGEVEVSTSTSTSSKKSRSPPAPATAAKEARALPKIRITFNAVGGAKIAASRAEPMTSAPAPAPAKSSPKARKPTIKIPPMRVASNVAHLSRDEPGRVGGGSRSSRRIGTAEGGTHGRTTGAGVLRLPPRTRNSGEAVMSLGSDVHEAPQVADSMDHKDEEVVPPEEVARQLCVKHAKKVLRKTGLPFRCGPFQVTSFGLISPDTEYHDKDFLYPAGYRCSHARFLRANSKQYSGRRLVIRCDSEVAEGKGSPVFRVEHSGQLLAQSPSAREAWHATLQLDQALARRTIFRLVRCKAVLNRLCCSSDVMAFLEAVDPGEVPGYFAKILRPVHMRLVDDRLKRGGYLNEFAFASDMRLAWSNAKLFNRQGSDLWLAADRLSGTFESLFCEWVINPPDGFGRGTQGKKPARGPWDDWQHLKYFDGCRECRDCMKASKNGQQVQALPPAADAAIDVMNTTMPTLGAKPRPDLMCSSCEDEWHSACLGPAAAAAAIAGSAEGRPFLCPRCTAWANAGGNAEGLREMVSKSTGEAGAAQDPTPSSLRVRTPQFHPHSSLPAGFQLQEDLSSSRTSTSEEAAAANLSLPSARQVVLTPDGIVVAGLATAEAYAKAYQGRVATDQKAKGSARKRDVMFTVPGHAGEDSAYFLMVSGLDRVIGGIAPMWTGFRLGPDGNFGLGVPDIKVRLEGLPGAERCSEYEFKDAAKLADKAEMAAEKRRRNHEAIQAVRDQLRSCLAEERFHWVKRRERAREEDNVSRVDTYAEAMAQRLEKQRKEASTGLETAKSSVSSRGFIPPTLGEPVPLFPGNESLSGCTLAVERALMAWDFLSSSRELVGFVPPPTRRIIDALRPPADEAAAIPSPSELAFSEACMLLTKVLLIELRDILRRHMSKKLVDEVLAQRPLNLLTWPEVAGDAVVTLVNHRAHQDIRTSEMAALLSVRPPGWLARCGDVVAILISQPLAAAFVRPVDPAQVPGYAEVVETPMDLSTVRRRLWSRRYQWHQQVMDDLRLVWANAKAFNQEQSDFWHAADSLSLLAESLYEAWVLQPERRKDLESMREAGLDEGGATGTNSVLTSQSMAGARPTDQQSGSGGREAMDTDEATEEMSATRADVGQDGGIVNGITQGISATPITNGSVQAAVLVKVEEPAPPEAVPTSDAARALASELAASSPPASRTAPLDPSALGTRISTRGAGVGRSPVADDGNDSHDLAAAVGGSSVSGDTIIAGAASAPASAVGSRSTSPNGSVQKYKRPGEAENDEADSDAEMARALALSLNGRSERLPLDPATVHPAFAGRRPLPRNESPASGRSYGLWDPMTVHPVYFGHLRHDGEASGAAGIPGWTGAGDGGAIDRVLRILRGAADSSGGHSGGVTGVLRWSAEQRAAVLGYLSEEAALTGAAIDHIGVLMARQSADAEPSNSYPSARHSDAGDADEDEELFEAPGDDEIAIPELSLVPADASDVKSVGGCCPLCGGAGMSGGSDLLVEDGEPWVLLPAEVKALPARVLPMFTQLRKGQSGVVTTSATEGAQIPTSSRSASWLRKLYRIRQGTSSAEMADSDDDSDGSSVESDEDENQGAEEKKPSADAAATVVAAEDAPASTASTASTTQDFSAVGSQLDENPLAARIAAHVGCARKLWRARYLALREERCARRQEERRFAFPEFLFQSVQGYDPFNRQQRYAQSPAPGQWASGEAQQAQQLATYHLQLQAQQHRLQIQQQQQVQRQQQLLLQQQPQHAQAALTGQYPGQAHSGYANPAAASVATVPSQVAPPAPAGALDPAAATPVADAGAGVAPPGTTSSGASMTTQGVPVGAQPLASSTPASSLVPGVTNVAGSIPGLDSQPVAGYSQVNGALTASEVPSTETSKPAAVGAIAVVAMPATPPATGEVDPEADVDTDVDEEELAQKLKADLDQRDLCRSRPLGRDRFGNEYWRFLGDRRMVFVRRHGCWWGLYEGPEKVQELVRSLDVAKDCERNLRNRIHEAIDVWGVSDKLETYLKTKRAARERLDPYVNAWGVFGGESGPGKKAKTTVNSFSDERRREEADRIRGNLERAVKPALWKRLHQSRASWLDTEIRSLETALPVQAAGTGDSAADFRFVAASIRQQRLLARSVELRLGEYLGNYDDQRASAIDEAYRAGDVDQLRQEKVRLKGEFNDDSADNRDGRGWLRNNLPATTRDIAAETRALRLLHPPDLRTPAQKRKDVEAFVAGALSAATLAAAAAEAAAIPERAAAREQALATALAAGSANAWQNHQAGANQSSAEGRDGDAVSEHADARASGGATIKSEGGVLPGGQGTFEPAAARQGMLMTKGQLSPAKASDSTANKGPASLSPRPGSSKLPGFDEDDARMERTYWEPSVAKVGLVSANMVKLKVEMLAMALCLPQTWERTTVRPPRGRTRGRPRQRTPSAVEGTNVVKGPTVVAHGAGPSTKAAREPAPLPAGEFFAPSRGIAPELTAALKEAVQEQAAYERAQNVEVDNDDHIDIGMDGAKDAAPPPAHGQADSTSAPDNDGDNKRAMEDSVAPAASIDQPGPSVVESSTPQPESSPGPDTEPREDQPFVRKAQGKWLSVESSSDEEDFADDDNAIIERGKTQPGDGLEAVRTAPPSEATAQATGEEQPALPSPLLPTPDMPRVAESPLADASVTARSDSHIGTAGAQVATPGALLVTEAGMDTDSRPDGKLVEPEIKTDPEPVNRLSGEMSAVDAVPTGDTGEQTETPRPAQVPEPLAGATDIASDAAKATETKSNVEILFMSIDLEDWRERVRRAGTPEELANLALELDFALPREEGWLEPWYKTDSFPEPSLGGGSSLAAVATRVFAMDRALRWNIIPRPRVGGIRLPGDLPRVWVFFYQCPLAPLCIRPCFHKGKCKFHRSGISRVDAPMIVPAPPYTPPYAAAHYATANATAYAASYYTSAPSAAAASSSSPAAFASPAASAPSYPSHVTASAAPAAASIADGNHAGTSTAISWYASQPSPAPVPAASAPSVLPPAAPTLAVPTPAALPPTLPPTPMPMPTAMPTPIPTPTPTPTSAIPRPLSGIPAPAPVFRSPPARAVAPVEGVAAAVAGATAAARGSGDSANAEAAQRTTIAPGGVDTAASAAAPASVVPGVNFAMAPAGTGALWANFPQPTPEQIRDFHSKAETALRDAWAATVGAPRAAQAAAWAASAAAAASVAQLPPPTATEGPLEIQQQVADNKQVVGVGGTNAISPNESAGARSSPAQPHPGTS